METFAALLAICAENSPVPGEFLAQRPMSQYICLKAITQLFVDDIQSNQIGIRYSVHDTD